MQDEIFARRLKNWESEGELTAFNLACVAEEQTVWNVLATTNQALHEQVISAIADCRRQKTENRGQII
jgi:hypothetical protein